MLVPLSARVYHWPIGGNEFGEVNEIRLAVSLVQTCSAWRPHFCVNAVAGSSR